MEMGTGEDDNVPKNYYWLTGYDQEGKRFLIYGGATEDEARRQGLEMLSGMDFQIKALPTRHLPTASRMLKGGILEKSHDLHKATRRLRHKNVGKDTGRNIGGLF